MGCCALTTAKKTTPFRYESYSAKGASAKAVDCVDNWLGEGSPEAKLLEFDEEWYDAVRNMSTAAGQQMPAWLARFRYEDLQRDKDAAGAVQLRFEALVTQKFNSGNEFWNGILFTYLMACPKPSEGLPLEHFDDLCVAIFNDAAMARRMVATFARADVNNDGHVSFPELVSLLLLASHRQNHYRIMHGNQF